MAYRTDARHQSAFVRRFGLAMAWAICLGLTATSAAAQSNSFGPISVPGTAVIFDPDDVLSAAQLAALRSNGSLSPTRAVKALSFPAGIGQSFTIVASGRVGCCSVANVGPNGYPGSRASITSLGSISGFVSPNGFPLLGVFTNGSPQGPPPPPYNYSAGVGLLNYYPLLNQVFIIGDGLVPTAARTPVVFNVPPKATELWLGFADAGTFEGHPSNYGDNVGSDTVSGALLQACPTPVTGNPIDSETLAAVPDVPPSRTCIGVGESVKLTAHQNATWTISSTSGKVLPASGLTTFAANPKADRKYLAAHNYPAEQCAPPDASGQVYGTQACFTAPYASATIVVKAKFQDNSTASKSFAVLQPAALIFQRLQWPNHSPDFLFRGMGDAYRMAMSSGVFMTPGFVSFANILTSEQDNPTPGFAVPYNRLFAVNQAPVWLVSCDKIDDNSDESNTRTDDNLLGLVQQKSFPWVFAGWNGESETKFAQVRTMWRYQTFVGYQLSKGQIEGPSSTGSFVPTPINASTASVLNQPYTFFYVHDDWQPPGSPQACEDQVNGQFTPNPFH